MANRDMTFASVQTAGQLLPNDLLQMIARGDTSLPGLKPQDYHLPAGVKLNEAVTQAWNRLLGVWKNFRELMERLPQTETGTTETRERWLLHLFSELGYGRLQSQRPIEIEARSYPISHKAQEPVAFYLVSFRWEIDHRNPMARGETRLSPHSMMQEFLNRSDKHLWGFVSNGLKLRLLRDNLSMVRSAYIEFDLWTMMENELYSDFFLLWLICHQSRLEIRTSDDEDQTPSASSCRLEHWYQNAVENGVRMMEELREGVQSAIEVIGAGLISHQANQSLKTSLSSQSLNAQDFYTQVLRLVYRLIFIFVAEERDLLKAPHTDETAFTIYQRFYSAARIRVLAGRRGGSRHGDLWAQLLLLFQALHHGEPALGLPALGSFLFDPLNTPDLNSCQLSNHDLLEAIRLLCYTRKNRLLQPVSYRNLGSEEMGSVYEALLEMVPEIDPEHGGFRLLVLPGNLRKSTASYYTPSTLVNALVDSALDPVIAERLSKAAPQDQETALLSLKVCDPACGSGHFLVAAAHRLAKRLASIRSHEEEPAPSVIQHALRDVIGHCVYGVDLNPMAVELCKITLWMEAMEPGKPLTFLDHHIQCGNSLLGCTPALLDRGIPDVAFVAMEGDDMSVCAAFKRLNKRGKAQSEIFAFDTDTTFSRSLSSAPVSEFWVYNDDTIQGLEAKSKAYHEYLSSASYRYLMLVHDAWCAAFAWEKKSGAMSPITNVTMETLMLNSADIEASRMEIISDLVDQYRFFHWHLAFPEVFEPIPLADIDDDDAVGWKGGFDCVLGNPPWEQNELKETEWFADKDPRIAQASGDTRKRMINALREANPVLYRDYQSALRAYQVSSLMYNNEAGLYPMCGRGRINTYKIFAELNLKLLSDRGLCGCIVPSGIATDDSTKVFFQYLIDNNRLRSLYDFENREGIFPGVHRSFKFCLLTLSYPSGTAHQADFLFFAHSLADLKEPRRHFQLSASDIALINPNTRTCPIFRGKADAELTKYIYRRVPVLIDENDPEHGNPWGISFKQGLFNMTSDSHLFRTRQELEGQGFELEGNHFVKGEQRYLPLYEAKMIHHFNHRFGDYAYLPEGSASTQLPEVPLERLRDPWYEPLPRYWVEELEVQGKQVRSSSCFLGFRDITNTTNERSVITNVVPIAAVSNKMPLLLLSQSLSSSLYLLGCLNSFACDFFSRFKIGATSLNFFIAKQLAVLAPVTYTSLNSIHNKYLSSSQTDSELSRHFGNLLIELIYTSYSLQPFAQDLGYDGPPFIWDEERRFQIRCELDALFFHLYLGTQSIWESSPTQAPEMALGSGQPHAGSTHSIQGESSRQPSLLAAHPSRNPAHPSPLTAYFPTPRHAVEYIMESFPIVKRKDEKAHGHYRTKQRILEIYDAMAPLFQSDAAHPTHPVYTSPLDPPPGPPCDAQGNFIPVEQWDQHNWPPHIHKPGGASE